MFIVMCVERFIYNTPILTSLTNLVVQGVNNHQCKELFSYFTKSSANQHCVSKALNNFQFKV